MERSKFDGKAIEGLGELVEHHQHQQEGSPQHSSDVAERDGSTNPSKEEEEKRVP
jgi:hypothetical protein